MGITRREFLKTLAAGVGSVAFEGFNAPVFSSKLPDYDESLMRSFEEGSLDPISARFLLGYDEDGTKQPLLYRPSEIENLLQWSKHDFKTLDILLHDRNQYHFLPDDEMVKGIWCYPGFETLVGFQKNPDVIGRRLSDRDYAANFQMLKLLDEYGVNTAYVSALNHFNGMDYYGALPDRRKYWADHQSFNHLMETFALAGNDDRLFSGERAPLKTRKEVSVLAYEDTIFLEWSKEQLEESFESLIRNTYHFARNYQIDVEPHAVDVGSWGTFRGNRPNQERLIKKFLTLCETMYGVAEKVNNELREEGSDHQVRFIPAIPYVTHPSRKMDHRMDYHSLFKELGYPDGVNTIKCHELILMSYSWTNDEMYETFAMKDDNGRLLCEDIRTPFTVAGSNFPNVWDPYLDHAAEFKRTPEVVREIQKLNPNCRGYQIFCNLSLMNSYKHSEERPYGLPIKGTTLQSGTTRDLLRNRQMTY
jgi:hypothetical protein